MRFDDFKREILLEAKKGGKFPGGIFWAFKPDSNDTKNKKRGELNFYIALYKNAKGKTMDDHDQAIMNILMNVKRSAVEGLEFDDKNNIEPAQTIDHEFSKEYELKHITCPFSISMTDKYEANFKKIKQYVKGEIRKYTQRAKLYTATELTNDGEPYETSDEDEEAAINYIDDMINNPDKFGGYETVAQSLDKIKDMSDMEFIDKYASKGPVEAWIAKKILDGINKWRDNRKEKKDTEKKKSNLPVWNDGLHDETLASGDTKEINIKSCIDNYDVHRNNINITYTLESTKPSGLEEGADFEVTFENKIFKFESATKGKFTFKFTIADSSGKYFETPVEKTITITVGDSGSSTPPA